ncbi:MAG: hypothetical protein ACE5K9_06325 [Candidatus Methylomirabilales bacterium]
MEREWKLRLAFTGLAILLWIALMFGPGPITTEVNYCSLYTKAPKNAQHLYELYKDLLNRW